MALITKLNNIAQAIGNKTGEPASTYNIDNMPAAISNIQTAFPSVTPTSGETIRFIDYDGTIVTEFPLEAAAELTALPELPTHEGLVGTGWNRTLTEVQTADKSMVIGALYAWADDQNTTVLKIRPRVNEQVTLRFAQDETNGVTIDWGDGSVVETVSGTGNVTATHTYTSAGATSMPIILKLTPDDEVDFEIGHGTSASTKFITGSVVGNYLPIDMAILGRCVIKSYAFSSSYLLHSIIISHLATAPNMAYAFLNCPSLQGIVLPNSITELGTNVFQYCDGINNISLPAGLSNIGANALQNLKKVELLTFPDTVTYFGGNSLSGIIFEKFSFPRNMTIPSNSSGLFTDCVRLKTIDWNGVTGSFGNSVFSGCYSLEKLEFPEGITQLGSSCCTNCHSLEYVKIPSTISNASANAFTSCYNLKTIKFADRSAFTSGFASGWLFNNSYNCIPSILDFSDFTQVPTITSNFLAYMPTSVKIIVPSTLLNDWKAASIWSDYASQIVSA